MNVFNDYLRQLRKEKKLTLVEVAKRTGFSHTYISQLERGERGKSGIPSPDILKKLSDVYEVDYNILMSKAGYINDISFGQYLRSNLEKSFGPKYSPMEISESLGISLGSLEDLLNDRAKPTLSQAKKISDFTNDSSILELVNQSIGDSKEDLHTSADLDNVLKELYQSFNHNYLLTHALDIAQLLVDEDDRFKQNEIFPFYNGHRLTDEDKNRILNVLYELFPEYRDKGHDFPNHLKA